MSLTINEIKTLLTEHDLLQDSQLVSDNDFDYVSYDSRDVKPNTLFFCKGNFKSEFITGAKAAGATGIVAEHPMEKAAGLDQFIVTNIQKAMSLLSAAFFGFPQDELEVIAITGTKGKTTTAYFLRDAIEAASHHSVALFSTINTVLGNEPADTFKSHLTTPESLDLFRNMRTAVNNGMKTVVMEVSSQAYLKNRVYGLKYNIGSFLNISPDHVGKNEHPTFANYLHCKEQLIVNSDVAIINAETRDLADVYYAAKATCDPDNIYLYARNGAKTEIPVALDFVYDSISDDLNNSAIRVSAVSDNAKKLDVTGEYQIGVPGDFNEGNATDAIIAAGVAGYHHDDLTAGLASAQIPGRMEMYQSKNHGTAYVDYAHNYASMNALLSFLKSQNPNGRRVTVVVGSPGEKGMDRREGFGKALSENADIAYLTTDDPAHEDPQAICDEIDSYIDHDKVKVNFELDRGKAIKEAIKNSKNGDMIVMAGKGRDPYQKIGGIDTPYPTDTQVVKDVI